MSEDKHYKIVWEIDVYASSPEEAARIARSAQRRPGTTATIYGVLDNETGKKFMVDTGSRPAQVTEGYQASFKRDPTDRG